MTDENATTADLTMNEKLDRILAELSDLKTRLSAVETQGAGTTRPLLDKIIQETVATRDALIERLEKVEKEVRLFGDKMDNFNAELLQLRRGQREVEDRLIEIEQRPN
ncbi:MAG TPA: hypothetical protein VJ810_00290 [Blastocatellia bacterium]|nr:hypothetical protein [Blastocatellia bacterium]